MVATTSNGAAGRDLGHTAQRLTHPPALVPVFVHLAIVLMLGLYIPPYLVDWYRQAAAFIG